MADVYLIDVAFADIIPATEEQIVQEANPSAVFSHLTALVHHGLTDQLPSQVQVTHYADPQPVRTPLGTSPEEWHELEPPPARRPKFVGEVPVRWYTTKGEWDFGWEVGYSQGQPVYVTDAERTLIDILRAPAEVGGAVLVFRAWRQAGPALRVGRLVEYVDRFDQPVLRQRVGYLLGQLGHDHPRMAEWRAKLQRGGSLRLIASEPYAREYSPEWNLSLNVPPAVLAELH
ncbi:MAG: hypothetical protein U0871_17510 [Gemmataceae bacterium]